MTDALQAAGRTSAAGGKSLEEVHGSVAIPKRRLSRLFAFAGPAYMVSVGYMDPGNWATDLEGGARFGYTLLWVLLMSNLMALLLQTLSARLGIVAGRDLAQACRDAYSPGVRGILFVLCEIAIAACDLAEVLGTALGLSLLSGMFLSQPIPLIWAIVITVLDVFLLLAIQRFGIRKMEAFILVLVMTVGACFIVELFLAKPEPVALAKGFIPSRLSGEMLLVAIGILGATVMPHNLYLHSALVQSRAVSRDKEGLKQACRYNLLDSAIALNCAFFVNCAILIVAAATFFTRNIEVAEIQQAHTMLHDVLGTKLAPLAFAIALICAGQSSTVTGTLAGQITMEGFLQFRIRPWLRRLITRSIAIIPAVIVIAIMGEQGTTRLLVISQVILSLQLPFAVIPLVKFTSSRKIMGDFATPLLVCILAWLITSIIVGLNAKLVYEQVAEWTLAAGDQKWLVLALCLPACAGLVALLLYMTFRSEGAERLQPIADADRVAAQAATLTRTIRRVGVALDAAAADAPMLAEAINTARLHRAELVLIHIVEGVGGQYHGARTDDAERRGDTAYINRLTDQLREKYPQTIIPLIKAELGFGDVRREIIRIATANQLDVLVMGGHGHRGLSDILRGTTIDAVRHSLAIPVVAVRN